VAQQSQQQRRGKIGSLQHKQSLVFLDLHLAKLCTWDFDMFHFAGTCSRPNAPSKPLAAVGYTLLHQFQLLNKLKLDPAVAFNCLDVIEVCWLGLEACLYRMRSQSLTAFFVCCTIPTEWLSRG